MPRRAKFEIPARLVKFDLNCDLGENEPRTRTAALMRYVTSANIACGGHAGDLESMRAAAKLAIKQRVRIGAHPGLNDPRNFGRIARPISAREFKTIVLQQVCALERIIRDEGARLHHIKLHGALYHMVEDERILCRAFVELVKEFWPKLVVYSMAGGQVARAVRRAGLKSWGEGFLDRGHASDGKLIPRSQPGAVLTPGEFKKRLHSLPVSAETWCIHSDTENSVRFARQARAEFSS